MVLSTPWLSPLIVAGALLCAAPVLAQDNGPWNVPLYFDSAGRYMVGVMMSNLTGTQNFSFAFSTGTGLISVASEGGNLASDAAGGPPLYNETKSITAQTVNDSETTSLFGQVTGSTIIKETCALVGVNQNWTYYNQTIVLVKDKTQNVLSEAANAQLGNEISGIIGLGTNRQANAAASTANNTGAFVPTYEDSIIGLFFHTWPADQNFIFVVELNSPVVGPSPDGGVAPLAGAPTSNGALAGTSAGQLQLYWSLPDYNRSTAGVAWVWVDPTPAPADANATVPPSDWAVVLDGWVASTSANQLSSKGQIVADLDPLYTGMYIPQDQAEIIHASIPGAQLKQGISTLGNLSMAYTVPCDTQLSFGIVIGQQAYIIDESTLIVTMSNGECVSSIEAWTNPFMTTYMFGARFASQLALIFRVDNNGTQSIGFYPLPKPSKSSLDVPAVVGGTVGGAALLVLTILGAFFLRRYYQRTAHTGPTPMAPSSAEPEEPKTPMSGAGWQVEPFTMAAGAHDAGGYTKGAPPGSPGAQSALVPNRRSEHGSPATTAHSLSPLPSAVVFLGDDRSTHVAPPSYRAGYDAHQPPSPVQTAHTGQTNMTAASAFYSSRAVCS